MRGRSASPRASLRLVTPKFLHSSSSSPVWRMSSAMVLMPRRIMHLRARTERFRSAIRPAQQGLFVGRKGLRLVVHHMPFRSQLAQRPFEASISLISMRLVSPKFLLESSSASDVRHRSPRVITPILRRQLRLRTRELEIGHRDVEHLAHPVALLLRILVVVHVARGRGVFDKEHRPG